ncbi:DUF3833 family protein [Kaistia terrae]|uniref:DUF3833 family protein n=1 Tax=Kaistia terrae TaxID=537017 RepID=A0ABW0PVC8_9HYPH|nr:DUF3833 family protein [Kaistia terrae]MCX5579430.1 DUF3833 family protein [Kaistia terrae]
MESRKSSLVYVAVLTLLMVAPVSAKDLSLEDYFAGKTSAVGSFSAINGVKRQFTVDLRGKWNGQTLTLVEDFVYSDGERDRKTWRFRKIAPNQYRGTREDVIGDTLVTVTGNTARFTYLVDLDAARKRNRVRFHDTMTLQDNGRLINNATITKFGLPVAKTRVEFSR